MDDVRYRDRPTYRRRHWRMALADTIIALTVYMDLWHVGTQVRWDLVIRVWPLGKTKSRYGLLHPLKHFVRHQGVRGIVLQGCLLVSEKAVTVYLTLQT